MCLTVVLCSPHNSRPWKVVQHRKGILPETSARHVTKGVLEALRDLNQIGMTHGDIKMSNIMFRQDDEVPPARRGRR